jgi:hypothetical protein
MGVPLSLARAAAMYKTTANDLAGEESALILPMAQTIVRQQQTVAVNLGS